jgi:hypothetical protein
MVQQRRVSLIQRRTTLSLHVSNKQEYVLKELNKICQGFLALGKWRIETQLAEEQPQY